MKPGASSIEKLLDTKNKDASRYLSEKIDCDLTGLQTLKPLEDANFDPLRYSSDRIYDKMNRIHFLEASAGFIRLRQQDIPSDPIVDLSDDDLMEYREAIKNIFHDQELFLKSLGPNDT